MILLTAVTWIIGILKFLCAAIGLFSLLLFVLVCIATVIYPKFDDNMNVIGANTRYVLAIICSVCFGILIVLL